jgi:cathepsin L
MYGDEEHRMRAHIFHQRLAQIEAHNGIETRFWHAGVNHLTDRTEMELNAIKGYRRHGKRTSMTKAKSQPQSLVAKGSSCIASSTRCHSMGAGQSCCSGLVCGAVGTCEKVKQLPKEVDWSEVLGSGKQVVDQGACGSCWAVAAQGAIELQLSLLANKSISLSAQGMLGCTPNPHECGGSGGCGGATPELAFEWASANGVVPNSEVPYTAESRCPKHPQPSVRIQGFVRVQENQALKVLQSLVSAGPLAVAVDASRWSSYMSGVFDSCSKDVVVDHAVVLVGYGQDPKLSVGYWKIRNSWGSGFGEDGFIRLRRHAPDGDEPCGWDYDPQKGVGCKGGPSKLWVCGECGILSDVVHPVGTQVLA